MQRIELPSTLRSRSSPGRRSKQPSLPLRDATPCRRCARSTLGLATETTGGFGFRKHRPTRFASVIAYGIVAR